MPKEKKEPSKFPFKVLVADRELSSFLDGGGNTFAVHKPASTKLAGREGYSILTITAVQPRK